MLVSKKPPTKAESERMEKLSRMGCIVTRLCFGAYKDADVHHITSGGRRLGHMSTIPLSPWYHRAVPDSNMTPQLMREFYGPSLAESKAEFEARFGTEAYLLEQTNKWLGQVPVENTSKHGVDIETT
jgi:hypothetical protein